MCESAIFLIWEIQTNTSSKYSSLAFRGERTETNDRNSSHEMGEWRGGWMLGQLTLPLLVDRIFLFQRGKKKEMEDEECEFHKKTTLAYITGLVLIVSHLFVRQFWGVIIVS